MFQKVYQKSKKTKINKQLSPKTKQQTGVGINVHKNNGQTSLPIRAAMFTYLSGKISQAKSKDCLLHLIDVNVSEN